MKKLDQSAAPTLFIENAKEIPLQVLTIGYTASGALFHVSESYARYFGRDSKDLLGKNLAWCFASRDIARVSRSISMLSMKSPTVAVSHAVAMPNGAEAFHYWLHTAKFADDGSLHCYQAAGVEIEPSQLHASGPRRLPKMLLEQHLERLGDNIVGFDSSQPRCFAP